MSDTILGCDLSSQLSGYAIIEDGELVEYDSVDTRNKNNEDNFEKYKANKRLLEELEKKYDVDHVFVEKPVKSFSSGYSNPKTIAILSKIFGMITVAIYELFGVKAETLKASTARKKMGLTVSKKSDKDEKQQAFEYIVENEDNFEYKETYAGNPKPRAYDRADSITIARAGETVINEQGDTKES